jgi:hypothetical protein
MLAREVSVPACSDRIVNSLRRGTQPIKAWTGRQKPHARQIAPRNRGNHIF